MNQVLAHGSSKESLQLPERENHHMNYLDDQRQFLTEKLRFGWASLFNIF